jgi:membrane-bound ClpP family serine protease
MCHIILASPVLALPLFIFLPFHTALPVYLAVVLVSGLIYFKVVAAMKSKVQTGIEGMTGGEAVVVEDLKPEGMVRFEGEIWTATALGEEFLRGKTVRIFGFQGLQLIVGEPNRDKKLR